MKALHGQAPFLCKECVLMCVTVHHGSIKQNFFAGVLSEFRNSWGFFSQLSRRKQINVEYRNCIQPCWLWAREIVTWQVRACNSPLCHTGCLSESRCCCIFLGLNTESCLSRSRGSDLWTMSCLCGFVNYVMPVWTWHRNHQLWWFFFIMWWVFLNSPSGTWTLEPQLRDLWVEEEWTGPVLFTGAESYSSLAPLISGLWWSNCGPELGVF